MPETNVNQAALDGIASKLRTASTDLEATENPPEVPEAGDATGILASILSHTTLSIDGAIGCLGAAGDAVAKSLDTFQDTEETNRDSMNGMHPE